MCHCSTIVACVCNRCPGTFRETLRVEFGVTVARGWDCEWKKREKKVGIKREGEWKKEKGGIPALYLWAFYSTCWALGREITPTLFSATDLSRISRSLVGHSVDKKYGKFEGKERVICKNCQPPSWIFEGIIRVVQFFTFRDECWFKWKLILWNWNMEKNCNWGWFKISMIGKWSLLKKSICNNCFVLEWWYKKYIFFLELQWQCWTHYNTSNK